MPRRRTLSVSCIGSNGLKLRLRPVTTADSPTFSILYRIEWVETLAHLRGRLSEAAFSILYRIEWVETAEGSSQARAGGGFQYPVSDRMG